MTAIKFAVLAITKHMRVYVNFMEIEAWLHICAYWFLSYCLMYTLLKNNYVFYKSTM